MNVPFSRATSLLGGQNSDTSYVKDTLFLSNDSLVPGNVVPTNSMDTSNPAIQGASNPLSSKVSVGNSPNGITYDPANGNLYVADFNPATVSVINGTTNTLESTINTKQVAPAPWDVAYNPSNGYIYVTEVENSNVSVINGANNTLLANIVTGGEDAGHPQGITYDSLKWRNVRCHFLPRCRVQNRQQY